jgi:hypothetical protein
VLSAAPQENQEAVVTVAAPPTETVAATVSATVTTSSTVAAVDWLRTASVEGGLYVLGNPAAPLRLTDYSDFL